MLQNQLRAGYRCTLSSYVARTHVCGRETFSFHSRGRFQKTVIFHRLHALKVAKQNMPQTSGPMLDVYIASYIGAIYRKGLEKRVRGRFGLASKSRQNLAG